eukprot:1113202-Alexandrium_andersonii.AAC.1
MQAEGAMLRGLFGDSDDDMAEGSNVGATAPGPTARTHAATSNAVAQLPRAVADTGLAVHDASMGND